MKRLSILILVILLGCNFAGCSKADKESQPGATNIGKSQNKKPQNQQASASKALVTKDDTLIKGHNAPILRAVDIRGQEIDFEKFISEKPSLIIAFFFSVESGVDVASKLKLLNVRYPQELRIVAVGVGEEEEALKMFADKYRIDYFVVDDNKVQDAAWLKEIKTSPLTIFVAPEGDLKILKVLRGGDVHKARLIQGVAENFMNRGDPDKAVAIADIAKTQNEEGAAETKGYALAFAGKLDEAEAEFGAIDSKTGLARVALERGDYDNAIGLAGQSDSSDGYADTIKAEALMRSGKLDEAAETFKSASLKKAEDWQYSEAANGMGRVKQEQGDVDGAIQDYQKAVELDHYNVVALSNEGSAHRQKGDLKTATQVLERAQTRRADDDMVVMMLNQVKQEMKNANDIKRGELIRAQIKDLVARAKELKAQGTDKAVDEWTTRPLIMAFLPGGGGGEVLFPRAGTDVVLRREMEVRLQGDDRVTVVEREMLDKLLQELQLGSSELVDPNTQTHLGRVLSANMLGFVEFGQTGSDILMYIRIIDTETTGIVAQVRKNIKSTKKINSLVDSVVADLLNKIVDDVRLQGLIADAESDDAVMINLGQSSGINKGQKFVVIEEGEPIEVGGKVIAHRQRKVAEIEVTEVEEAYSICKVSKKRDNIKLAKDMKIKEPSKK